MKFLQNPFILILYRTAQVLYFPALLLIVGWQKILSMFGISESGAMSDIEKLLILVLCVGLPIAVTIAAWVYVLLVANKNKKTVNTQQAMIVSDRARVVTWIIKNFIGWIYVIEGEQVGIVGSKIYNKSGLFFEWLGAPKRISVLSYQDYHTDVSIKTVTREETQVEIDIIVEYSARKEHASDLLKLKADPVTTMKRTLEAILVKIIQEYYYDVLTGKRSDVELDIKLKFEEALKYYNFNVSGLRIGGERAIIRSGASMETDRLTDAAIKQKEALLEGGAQVEVYKAQKQIDYDMRHKEFDKIKQDVFGQNAQQQTGNQAAGTMSTNRQIEDISAGAFDMELKRIVNNSPMKFIQASSPYRIAYNGHGIQLLLDETNGSVTMGIWNSKMEIASKTQPLTASLQALLVFACEHIDKEVAKRKNG